MPTEQLVQLDTNVDDLDPRVVPHAIERLLAAGAVDAWATPILMKKGRPAFLLSALVTADDATLDGVRDTMFRETTTIGIRETVITRHALDRRTESVEVDGQTITVKIATRTEPDGSTSTMNTSAEWDDVVRAAAATGRAAVDVLAEAHAAARRTT